MRGRILGLVTAMAAMLGVAHAQAPDASRTAFRAIYEELVEIDTSSAGSCTRAAEAMAARLRAAGYPQSDLTIVIPEGRPTDGNLIATLRGRNARAGALLLLAHIDVVDARREDWARDPFTLVEEDGFFYGRGAADDKAMAAVFVDLLIRLKQEGFRPRQNIKMALTCGEETSATVVNGVRYIMERNPQLLRAALAINEGAGGELDAQGRYIALHVQAGEKIHQQFRLEVVNPGGHSSRPRPDNAINQLSAGLLRVAAYQFPVELTPAVREFFRRMAPLTPGETGLAMAAIAANPSDAAAAATLAADPSHNAIMRTTCIATTIEGGHAVNALPQRARAVLSCRILPGHTPDEVEAELVRVLNDPGIAVTLANARQPTPAPPPLSRAVMAPVERVAARLWPNVPIVPTMAAGATDARFLNGAGIAVYGMSGMFAVPGESNAHGLNEKIRVRSLYEGRDFLEGLVREYAK
ncbi:MAG: M20/M25/M40 family metallo-hydrolase [Hyphomonadaceae bacterium]|nr:M20/M25/M40 family metallo-hydrolase [Hyphomonadaceae bacterium]